MAQIPHVTGGERAYLAELARRLYVLAWVIEGIAVALGLGMAIALNNPGQSSAADFLLGSGGFIMVACAELSKIPLATFFVQTASGRAKLATLVFLLLMSFITFETIFFSLERGFNARMLVVRAQAEELSSLYREREKLSEFIENPTNDLAAKRSVIERRLAEIDGASKLNTGTIGERRQALRREQHESQLPAEIETQLRERAAEQQSLRTDFETKLTALDERMQKDLRSLTNQLEAARRSNDAARYYNISRTVNFTRNDLSPDFLPIMRRVLG